MELIEPARSYLTNRHAAQEVEMGVIDPTKVTRIALQNATSVAALILTTDCMIAEIPEKRPAGPGAGEMEM